MTLSFATGGETLRFWCREAEDVQQRLIWCEPRVIITINKVVTGRFAPEKTDNITNGYAKIQKIIQKDCRNAENPHCIFHIFAVTLRAPAGDSNDTTKMVPSSGSG